MKIKGIDIFTQEPVLLTASFTTEHPASSYGQPVMIIDEWDEGAGLMDYNNWIINNYCVEEATSKEMKQFEQWVELMSLMLGESNE